MAGANSGASWDLAASGPSTTSETGEYRIQDLGSSLEESGILFVFYGLLHQAKQAELESRMQGSDWQSLGQRNGVRWCTYNTITRLERVIDLLSFGLPPAESHSVRAALVPMSVADGDRLFEAAQRVEYLAEIESRVKQNWLQSLFQHPTRFFNVFQPLVDLRNGQVLAYEMLIRARGEESGSVIGAGQLIGAAKDSKLLYTLDLLSREVAIKTASRLFPQSANVFINFMPNSVLDPEKSLEQSMQACMTNGLSSDRVVFEVVESERIEDMAYLTSMLDSFRKTGFQIALDDLGSGYAGLNYMHQISPDYVKLDRELVDGCAKVESQRVLINKLVEAAHDLHIRVVAEGIEREEDFKCIRDLGADIVQGYWLARPSPDRVFEPGFNLLEDVLKRESRNS